jgi:hypothetical protein
MTGAKPIKQKRSPRPPRPRRPRPPLLSHRVFEKLRNGLIEFKDDDVEHFGLEEWGRFWLVGRAAIQARLDNGEIDAATVEKLVEQLHIDAKIAARRAGEAWIDAKLAEYEANWKEKGYALPVECWGYLQFARLFAGNRWLPPEAQTTIIAALEAQFPKVSKTERRAGLVRFFLDGERLTWPEAFEEAGKICGVGPEMMKKSYQAWERGLPPEHRRRNRRRKQG